VQHPRVSFPLTPGCEPGDLDDDGDVDLIDFAAIQLTFTGPLCATLWSPLEGPAGNGVDGIIVLALTTYDDGTGPALYTGGFFTTAGGVPVNNIAEWTRPGPPCE